MTELDNFHFRIEGNDQGPKIVFLHGLLGSLANWRKITSAFTNQYHMLSFDQRGHGRSFHPNDGYTPTDYANDVRILLNEFGWSKVFIVGHSMGARNALEFAHLYPERVKGLIVEDIPLSKIAENATRMEDLIRSVPVPFPNRRVAKEYFLNDFVSQWRARPQVEMLGQFFFANIVENAEGQGVWRFNMPGIIQTIRSGRKRDWTEPLRDIMVPTLLIRGAQSDELLRDEYERILQLSPLIQGVEVADAGHWVHTDQTQRFCSILENFIQSVQTVASRSP